MQPTTLAALARLAAALEVAPDDRAELAAYGALPDHLADAIEDHRPPADD